jgi:ubiquinone/menaquinone biosynthesis C-methylase UbiE
VDLVFYAMLWHELDDVEAAVGEAARIAAPGGRIAILDWRKDCSPPPGPPREHRIADSSVVALLQAKGCKQVLSQAVGQFTYLVTAELNKPSRI